LVDNINREVKKLGAHRISIYQVITTKKDLYVFGEDGYAYIFKSMREPVFAVQVETSATMLKVTYFLQPITVYTKKRKKGKPRKYMKLGLEHDSIRRLNRKPIENCSEELVEFLL